MSELKPCRKRGGNAYTDGAYERNPRLYNIWKTMLHRCEDSKRQKYKDYGGRGIKVCSIWHNPHVFMNWAEKNGYSEDLRLDRIDNDGDYTPSNCRWVTPKENSRNRRNTVYLTLKGETKSVAEWCESIDVSPYTVYWWVRSKGKEYAERRLSEIA